MQFLTLSIVIGVLAGAWTFVSGVTGLLTWPAFVGWAIFFFSGGNAESLKKSIPPVLSGLILGYLSVVAWSAMAGELFMLAVLVAIIAFIMTFMMNIGVFALAPAAFAACAVFFGAGDPIAAGVPLLIGLALGYISVLLPELFKSKSSESSSV